MSTSCTAVKVGVGGELVLGGEENFSILQCILPAHDRLEELHILHHSAAKYLAGCELTTNTWPSDLRSLMDQCLRRNRLGGLTWQSLWRGIS